MPNIRRRAVRRPRRRAALRRSRMPRSMVQSVHYFKRSVWLPSQFTMGAAAVFGALNFNLNALPNATEFTTLFDQYKICNVKVSFMPRGNSAEGGTNNNIGKLFTVIDYDDDTAPTSIDQLMQYPNLTTTAASRTLTRSLKPKFAASVYQTAVLSGYGARTGWLDCDATVVPHYGIKYAAQATAGANIFDLKIDYIIACKGIR